MRTLRTICLPLPLAAALAVSAAAGEPTRSPQDDTAFAVDCSGEEFAFAGMCTGRVVGVIGVGLFDFRDAVWDRADDALLVKNGLRNVTDPKANRGPRSDWPGLACTTTTGTLLDLKGVLPDFLYEVRLYQCRGPIPGDGRLAVEDIELYVTPEGPWIGEFAAIYRGHPDNAVDEGSFREALEQRFGAKNCDDWNARTFCRKGERSQITVTQLASTAEGSRFAVRISTPAARERAIARVEQEIAERRRNAPVEKF